MKAVTGGLSKNTVLRLGYGAVIAVLVLSAVEAYRIQVSVSEQHVGIYRHYVEQEAALATLRRSMWQAGTDVRDFFIRTTPEQAEKLRAHLAALRGGDSAALAKLERMGAPADAVAKLRRGVDDFWNTVDPVPDTMLGRSDQTQFEYLQQEIVPRRDELYSAVLELTTADQRRLQASEAEFAATRRTAAERLLLTLVFGLLLGLAVARLSLRHAETLGRRAERHFAEVEQARHELQQLSARLLEIEEEGRRYLSRELHDEIGQTLALLQIEISRALGLLPEQPEGARERLRRARDLAERTVQTVRHISLLLRPALLDDLGLSPALQFQLEEFSLRSRIACEFVEDGISDQLPDAVKTCVYRVVQEALHNSEKHSGATSVRVVVRQRADGLVAEIEDNGKGFTLNAQGMPSRTSGLGLLGLRERAALAGGSLAIDSVPERGTRIALTIPLAAPVVAAAAGTGG